MLYIYIEPNGREGYDYVQSNYVCRVSEYFDNFYEDSWFDELLVKDIVKEIDKVDIINARTIVDEVAGALPVTALSSGVKALILLCSTDKQVNGDRMGDNCVNKLMEIAKNKDIHISLDHLMRLPDAFEAIIENEDLRITSYREFVDVYTRYKYEM